MQLSASAVAVPPARRSVPTTLSRRTTSLGTWKRVEDTAINEREGV